MTMQLPNSDDTRLNWLRSTQMSAWVVFTVGLTWNQLNVSAAAGIWKLMNGPIFGTVATILVRLLFEASVLLVLNDQVSSSPPPNTIGPRLSSSLMPFGKVAVGFWLKTTIEST